MALIPLYDTNPLRYIRHPYVTWALLAANILVFFFVEKGGIGDADQGSAVAFGLIPAVFDNLGERPADLAYVPSGLTLLTYAFLHGGFWHLLGNMVFLWVFADNIEDAMGHVRFLIFYCLCAIGGGYAYVLSAADSPAPLIGASGAIAGIVAAYFILHPYAKVWILLLGRIPLRLNAVWVLGFWIVFQVYTAFAGVGDSQVAWWTHVGGLVTGAVLVLVLRRRGTVLFSRADPGAPIVAPVASPPPPPPEIDGPWGRR
jgi:membrane associated rhomboid family serine protease